MKPWKVERLTDPHEASPVGNLSAIRLCDDSNPRSAEGFWGYLTAYKIQSVCGISWENIPDDVKGENISGYRFIYLRDPRITINDFDIRVINAQA